MELYPALKAHMGDWTYYIVKMQMQEVAAKVKFGSQVHSDKTLDEAIQRTITESRVKRDIVNYLKRREDRFFASLVVAAIGGSPKFYPVSIAEDPQFEILADEESIEQSFGVLKFSGAQDYYALDGQHRLKAIKTLLQPEDESDRRGVPPGFAQEELSVLMVIRPSERSQEDWLSSYRRLFSSLNRYAKPTDKDTNIIMDEDDIISILTRRLIETHSFFQAPGRHLESLRVQTKGRPLKEGTSYFTSLQQLYDLNETLLTTHLRVNRGWGSGPEAELDRDIKNFKRFAPQEDYVDELLEELTLYWDAIIAVIPDLSELNPSDARDHKSDGTDGKVADNALFWPIGQDVMISVARALLDKRLAAPETPTLEDAKDALRRLGKVDWRLHRVPWRGLLLVFQSDRKKWAMRSEDRKEAIKTTNRLLRWIVGVDQLVEQEERNLRANWEARLTLPAEDGDRIHELWGEIANLSGKISAS